MILQSTISLILFSYKSVINLSVVFLSAEVAVLSVLEICSHINFKSISSSVFCLFFFELFFLIIEIIFL